LNRSVAAFDQISKIVCVNDSLTQIERRRAEALKAGRVIERTSNRTAAGTSDRTQLS
jgi:hypothetical protein